MSLIVALYTIKLATSPSSSANSYGWQRAEILGALIHGVFLLALCVSIALEAMGRVFAPPEISNPKLIVIVGSLGLLSNIVGLFLFHGESASLQSSVTCPT
jgi:zinc transporter 1